MFRRKSIDLRLDCETQVSHRIVFAFNGVAVTKRRPLAVSDGDEAQPPKRRVYEFGIFPNFVGVSERDLWFGVSLKNWNEHLSLCGGEAPTPDSFTGVAKYFFAEIPCRSLRREVSHWFSHQLLLSRFCRPYCE